jgi:drug/metabolite transporter (DMT)-like permease
MCPATSPGGAQRLLRSPAARVRGIGATIDVFVGPTLSLQEARLVLEANYRPPAAQGDIFRAAERRPVAIGIIDGYFQRIASVWHKEILWAMKQGVHVFGSASMGALRAAELHMFGMRGVGQIFADYRDGVLVDDDEVAVLHGPAEVGFVAVSEAMVNIRCTLAVADEKGVISPPTKGALEVIAKGLFYQDRTYATLIRLGIEGGLPRAEIDRFEQWLPGGRINQKKLDAVEMLQEITSTISTFAGPMVVDYELQETQTWLPEKFDSEIAEPERGCVLGIVLYVTAMALSVLMSASGKWLTTDYSVVQVVFFRVLFAFIPVFLVFGWQRRIHFSTRKPVLQLFRGTCMLVAMCLFFLALRYLPLADTEAAFATTPLFMTLLAASFLGERLSRITTGAVVLGLLGSLLILRPTQGLIRAEAVLPLVAAVFAAFAMISTRRLAQTDASSTTFCWGNAVVLLGTASALPAVWLTPTAADISVIVLMGVAGGLSTYCEIEACRYAPISKLAPFDYTSLIWAALFGYALWGDVPAAWTWIGAAAIVIGGLHVVAASATKNQVMSPPPARP